MLKLGSSYFGNRIVKHVRKDMEELATHNFNQVIHCFNENDFWFYKETMKEIVDISHDLGLEVQVDPWGVGGIFGGEAFTVFVPRNWDAAQVLSDGSKAAVACPNQPAFRKFMHEWVESALYIGADYVFWDEPHFYIPSWVKGKEGVWGCTCDACKEKYQEMYGADMSTTELTPEVIEFRQKCIAEFLEEMFEQVTDAGKKNCLCVFPTDDPTHGISDWNIVTSIKGLHQFGSDPYWVVDKSKVPRTMVKEFSDKVMEQCQKNNLENQIWIQGFKISSGKEEDVQTAIETALECGITNLAVWGFHACGHMSYIACDNSEKVWNIICRSFGTAVEKYK